MKQFVRVMLFVSAIVLYGDVIVPINRLVRNGEALLLPTVKLVLHCIWIWNTVRTLMCIDGINACNGIANFNCAL